MLSCVIVASAQNGAIPKNAISGYAGRYFLIGFMQNEIMILPGGIRLSITISTIRPTTILIASPISRPSQFYQITGDTVIELTFPYGDVEMFDSERAMLKAIEIESDQPITVSGMSSQSLSTDGFSAIPVSKWGREYVIHSWPNDIYMHDDDPQGKIPRSSQFMIIAAEDNTVIEFTPRSRTFQKIQSGESTIIQLNKGQCYLVKSDTLPAGSGDLSGTIVRSDKPIGVFSGHVRTAIPLGLLEFDSKNHLTEMLYPTEQWGKSFVTLPFNNDGMGDFFRIHCIEPNTNVTVKGWNINQTHILTNPGDFKTLSFIRDPLLIEADKPISIAQYMTSSFSANERLQTFDPCMMLIPSIDKAITKASFHVINNPPTNPKQFSKHFISLVCTEDAVDYIMLDNRYVKSIVSNLPNQRMNGTQLFYATVPVSPGTHHITTMEGAFNAALYGTGSDDAYAYPLAFGMVKGIDTSAPRIVMKDSCGIIKGTIQEPLINDYSGLHDISVIRDSTQNMNWALAGIRDGDLSATFTGSVINMLKDASFVIESIDNAGNSSRNRYYYTAPKISIPDTLRFSKINIGDTIRQSITVKNEGKETISIEYGKVDGDNRIVCENITELNNRRLAPNDSIALSCSFIGMGSEDTARANLRIFLGCGIVTDVNIQALLESMSLSVIGHDFGNVSVGDMKSGMIRVVNTGGIPLNSYSIEMMQLGDFILDTAGIFPRQILPLDTFMIPCRFAPKSKSTQSQSFRIINDKSLPNQAELKGNGIVPSINGFIIDWKDRHIASKSDTIAIITNTGNDTAHIHFDMPTGSDTIFKMYFPGGRSDTSLGPNRSIDVLCTFIPADTIQYAHSGFIRFSNGFMVDSTRYELKGKGMIPRIQLHDIYVGRIREQTVSDTMGLLFESLGSMPLRIQKAGIVSGDSTSFNFDMNDFIGKSFSPNESYFLPITFIPKRAGRHEIEIELVSDAAPFGQQSIMKSRIFGDADPIDTIAVLLDIQTIDTMHMCEQRVISGIIINNGNIDVMLNSLIGVSRFGKTIVSIQSIADSLIVSRGGSLSFSALIEAQAPGDDIIDFSAILEDTLNVKISKAMHIISNHVYFDSKQKDSIEFLPGDNITITFQGSFDFPPKTSLTFEPKITLDYIPTSLDCISSNTELIVNTSSDEIRIPTQVATVPGKTILTGQTQSSIQGSGTWQTTLRFRSFLSDDPGEIKVAINEMVSTCIIGDTANISLRISDFCAKNLRTVTGNLKGQGFLGIFPHPIHSEGNLSVLLHEETDFTIDIKNLLGETVKAIKGKGNAGLNIFAIDAEGLPSGSYTLIFQSVNFATTRQFIITKE
ncbi:MAG: hypothetical protein ACO3YM_02615 [Candidatus Kapaibacteriota bacterium]